MALKREIFTHLISFILFFFLIFLIKGYLRISFFTFWIGGIIGTILPDLDHLLYVYFARPYELTSQRVNYEVSKKDFGRAWSLLTETRYERVNLVFHSFLFQVIFFILTFFVMSSSQNFFGRGLVLAFYLHLLIDQMIDLMKINNLNNWFSKVNLVLDKSQATLYWVLGIISLLFVSLVF